MDIENQILVWCIDPRNMDYISIHKVGNYTTTQKIRKKIKLTKEEVESLVKKGYIEVYNFVNETYNDEYFDDLRNNNISHGRLKIKNNTSDIHIPLRHALSLCCSNCYNHAYTKYFSKENAGELIRRIIIKWILQHTDN